MWALNGKDGSELPEHQDSKTATKDVELPPICSSPVVVVTSDGTPQLLIPFETSLKLCPLTSGFFSFECGLAATAEKQQQVCSLFLNPFDSTANSLGIL